MIYKCPVCGREFNIEQAGIAMICCPCGDDDGFALPKKVTRRPVMEPNEPNPNEREEEIAMKLIGCYTLQGEAAEELHRDISRALAAYRAELRPEPTADDRKAAEKLFGRIMGCVQVSLKEVGGISGVDEKYEEAKNEIQAALSAARGDEREECELGNALFFANQQSRLAEARCLKEDAEAKVKALAGAAMYLATLNGNIQEKKHDPYGYEYFMGDGKQGLNVWVSAREIWSARKALGRNPVNNAAQLEVE